jgi:hypothetical protein
MVLSNPLRKGLPCCREQNFRVLCRQEDIIRRHGICINRENYAINLNPPTAAARQHHRIQIILF